VHPRIDRAVLADLVSQSMDIVEPREVSDEQSDVTTERLEDRVPRAPDCVRAPVRGALRLAALALSRVQCRRSLQ
jgi:hypothetical protein